MQGVPNSEYSDQFSWADGASEAYKHRAVTANRRSAPAGDTRKGLAYTLGGQAAIEETATAAESISTIPVPPPKVSNTIAATADAVKAAAEKAASSDSKRVFSAKASTRPSTASSGKLLLIYI